MKMRRILILALAVMVMLAMTAVPTFAATKQAVQVADKYYSYNEVAGDYLLNSEWHRDYKDGFLQTHKSISYLRNYEDPSKVDSKSNFEVSAKYTNNGMLKKRIMKYDDGSKLEATYSYKGKNVTTFITKYKGKNSNKTAYTYNKKGLITKQTNYYYESGKWVKGSYTKYTFDSKGRETKYEYYSKDNPDEPKLKRQNWYEVSYSGKKRTEKHYNYEDKMVGKNVYTMDSKGRDKKLVQTSIYYFTDQDPQETTSTTTYTYYNNGQVKKESTKGDGYTETRTFRSDGQMLSQKSKGTDYERSTEISYNKKGLITKEVSTYTHNSTDENGETVTDTTKDTWKYKYEGYYKNKYPKVIYISHNGQKYSKDEKTYKYIVDKTPAEVLNIGMGAG